MHSAIAVTVALSFGTLAARIASVRLRRVTLAALAVAISLEVRAVPLATFPRESPAWLDEVARAPGARALAELPTSPTTSAIRSEGQSQRAASASLASMRAMSTRLAPRPA